MLIHPFCMHLTNVCILRKSFEVNNDTATNALDTSDLKYRTSDIDNDH